MTAFSLESVGCYFTQGRQEESSPPETQRVGAVQPGEEEAPGESLPGPREAPRELERDSHGHGVMGQGGVVVN